MASGPLSDAALALSGFARPNSPGGLLGDALSAFGGPQPVAATAQTPEQRRVQAYFDWLQQASPQEQADDRASGAFDSRLRLLPRPRQDFAEGEKPPLTAAGQRTSDALAREVIDQVGQRGRDEALSDAMWGYRSRWPWLSRLAGP